jgi:PAS domain S-box-containing protein
MNKKIPSPHFDLLVASLDRIGHGVLIYDRDLTVVSINEQAREILRLPEDEFSEGEPFEKIVRLNARRGGYGGASSIEDRVAIRMAKAYSFEAYREEQHVFYGNWVEVSGQPVGEIGYVITYTDITSRSLAEASVRESEKRFRDFAETSSDWFWETDQDHRYSFISESFRFETGFDPDGWVGKDRYETLEKLAGLDINWATHKSEIDAYLPFRDFEYSFIPPAGGKIWVSVNGRPVFDPEGRFTGYRGSSKNVTRQVKLRRDLRHALEQARMASSAKSDFLSSVSHELRTPLNAVIGFSQLSEMDRDEPLSKNQEISVREILHAGEHLVTLIDQILDLSRIETGNISMSISRVEPATTINACIALVNNAARERGLVIHVPDFPNMPTVKADPVRLKQVLLNLLMNAIKYNSTGRRVDLKFSREEHGIARFEISDDGPGIPFEKQDALFTAFDRLGMEAKNIEGTGIGLTISKKLIELMGGKIGFRSNLGQGATFWLDLPLWDAAPEPAAGDALETNP